MGWKDDLAPEYRDASFLEGVSDDAAGLNAFAKSAQHAQAKVRAKGVIPPGKDASIADYDTFYSGLGRPTEKRSYEPGDFPNVVFHEEVTRDEEFEKVFLQELYDSGTAPYQAERNFQAYAKDLERREVKRQVEVEQVEARVEKDLSTAFGLAKDARLADAWDALTEMVGEEQAGELVNTTLEDGRKVGDLVPLLSMLAEQGKTMKGHTGLFPGADQKTHHMQKTPEEASAEFEALKADPEWTKAWQTKRHPGHANAQAQATALQNIMGMEA